MMGFSAELDAATRFETDGPAEAQKLSLLGRVIDIVCLVALFVVIGTVIYGFTLRAMYERSYYIAVVLAVIGAIVMVLGLAQQTIAARDAATWRHMAQWQIRAAHRVVAARIAADPALSADEIGPDSATYQEFLVEALVVDMQEQSGAVGVDG